MITQGERVAQAALGWLGTPHQNNAKVKGIGVDCGMLLIAALEDADIIECDEIKIKPYSNAWHLHHSEEWFLRYVQNYCERVDTMQPGDFLLYQFGRCISHGGVYIGNHIICHAYVQTGVILSDLDDLMLRDSKGRTRLRGIYRYRYGII